MYLEFFGFKEVPFSIAPDPRYLYMSQRHREALAHLLYGIRSEGGFVLLTGEVGTGKTTVCRCLLEQVPVDTEIAFVINPKVTTLELLATICDELHIPYPQDNRSIKVFLDRINARLLENYSRNRRTVLIIDEAQNLEADVLEQIRLLTNLETNERKLLQIIMLGQPELRTKLARQELRNLAQRITARYHLEPLSRRETLAYVRHRLHVGGVRRRLFRSSALYCIHRLSGGIPRRINVLCDRSLLGAYVQGHERVNARTVGRAAREVFARRQRIFSGRRAAALLLLAGASLAPSYLHQEPDPGTAPPVVSAAGAGIALAALEWPEGQPLPDSRRIAFDSLFQIWNLETSGEDPCLEAEKKGFVCMTRRDGLEMIRRFNLPAVLPLNPPNGPPFSAVLIALDEKQATFRLGQVNVTVPLEALQTRWSGEYVLIWRQPPFEGILKPGDRGEPIRWLAGKLGEALDLPALAGSEPILEGVLLEQLKRFQFSKGLPPDGMVGPNTLILLDAATGQDVPRLAAPREV